MIYDAIARYNAGTFSSLPMPEGPSMGSPVRDEAELGHEGPTHDATVGDELVSPRVDATSDPMGVTSLASSSSLPGMP